MRWVHREHVFVSLWSVLRPVGEVADHLLVVVRTHYQMFRHYQDFTVAQAFCVQPSECS